MNNQPTMERPLGDIATSAINEAKGKVNNNFGDIQDQAKKKAKEFQSTAKDYVTQKPLQTLAVTLGVGLLVGLILGRR